MARQELREKRLEISEGGTFAEQVIAVPAGRTAPTADVVM
jgi:hypothetical protein